MPPSERPDSPRGVNEPLQERSRRTLQHILDAAEALLAWQQTPPAEEAEQEETVEAEKVAEREEDEDVLLIMDEEETRNDRLQTGRFDMQVAQRSERSHAAHWCE